MTDRQKDFNILEAAVWGVLEDRLETFIRLDLNDHEDTVAFATMVADVTHAVWKAQETLKGILEEIDAEADMEYGVRTILNTAQVGTREQAERFMRIVDNPNAVLVRRTKAGEWEEVK